MTFAWIFYDCPIVLSCILIEFNNLMIVVPMLKELRWFYNHCHYHQFILKPRKLSFLMIIKSNCKKLISTVSTTLCAIIHQLFFYLIDTCNCSHGNSWLFKIQKLFESIDYKFHGIKCAVVKRNKIQRKII